MFQLDCLDNVKLADVGLTKLERDISGTRCGTTCYAAPEVLEGSAYDKTADVYSLGVVTWELWYGRLVQDEMMATAAHKGGDVEKAMREGQRPSLLTIHEPSQQLAELITSMWSHEPKSRPTAAAILECLTTMK